MESLLTPALWNGYLNFLFLLKECMHLFGQEIVLKVSFVQRRALRRAVHPGVDSYILATSLFHFLDFTAVDADLDTNYQPGVGHYPTF